MNEWECREILGRTDQDVGFWLDVARFATPGAGILELACGTGRVTLPLAAAGFEVVGLDIDAAALAVARGRQGRSAWPLLVAADMRRFALRRRFGAVIVPYNSFQLLADPADAASCLATVLDHLAPGGTFALEVTDFQAGARQDDVPEEVLGSGDFEGRTLTLSGSLTHDRARRQSRYRRRFASEGWSFGDEVVLRSYAPDELAGVLRSAGMAVKWCRRDGPVTRAAAGAG